MAENYVEILNDAHAKTLETANLIVGECSFDMTAQDTRLICLNSIRGIILGVLNWERCLTKLTERCTLQEFLEVLDAPHISEISKHHKAMVDLTRHGAFILMNFRVESALANILEHLDQEPSRRHMENVSMVLELCNIPDDSIDYHTFNVLAAIRNSFHNNGIHRTGGNFLHTIGGLEFRFEEGEPVLCAGIEHFAVLTRELARILDRLFLSEPIRTVREIIPDDFATGEL